MGRVMDEKELDGLPWHPLLPFAWDAVRVAGDHLLGIADLKRPVVNSTKENEYE